MPLIRIFTITETKDEILKIIFINDYKKGVLLFVQVFPSSVDMKEDMPIHITYEEFKDLLKQYDNTNKRLIELPDDGYSFISMSINGKPNDEEHDYINIDMFYNYVHCHSICLTYNQFAEIRRIFSLEVK